MADLKDVAHRALSCLDLTNLNDDCTDDDIVELCKRARSRYGNVAAVCIWPRFVSLAARQLGQSDVRIATVVNFPTGDENAADVMDMTKQAREDGAHEIDMVIPWKALLEGHPENVSARVARVVSAAEGAKVKAIIESGMLGSPEYIRQATEEAINGGADFVKTSTGKVPVNATPDAARIILTQIKESDPDVGFKAAGGVRSTQDAADYFALADEIMGPDWATPERFRFGASGVLDALLATLGETDAPEPSSGY